MIADYVATLGLNTKGAIKNLDKFDDKAKKSGKDIESRYKKAGNSIRNSFSGLGGKLSFAVAGAGVFSFLKSATSLAIEFETSMSRVKVALGATEGQSKNLEKQARDIGKATIFSASEVSKAQLVLAKNGKKYQEIMGGMTEASLNLSGALGADLGSSADLVTDALAQFSLKTKDSHKVVDRLAGAANKSKFSFNDLRLAYAQAGGTAGKVGVEFEDFNAAIVAISPSFASGSDAGTSLKTLLSRLVPEGKAAKEMMQKLGLTFFDSAGNMDSMATISGKLNKVFSNMTEEQKLLTAKTLFGNDASRAALTLAGNSAIEFNKLKEAISGVSAAEVSIGNLGSTERSIKQLKSAWEEFQLQMVDSGALDLLTKGINNLKEIVSKMPQYFTQIKDLLIEISNLNPFTEHLQTSKELKALDEERLKNLNQEINNLPKNVGIKVNLEKVENKNFFSSLKGSLQNELNSILKNVKIPKNTSGNGLGSSKNFIKVPENQLGKVVDKNAPSVNRVVNNSSSNDNRNTSVSNSNTINIYSSDKNMPTKVNQMLSRKDGGFINAGH